MLLDVIQNKFVYTKKIALNAFLLLLVKLHAHPIIVKKKSITPVPIHPSLPEIMTSPKLMLILNLILLNQCCCMSLVHDSIVKICDSLKLKLSGKLNMASLESRCEFLTLFSNANISLAPDGSVDLASALVMLRALQDLQTYIRSITNWRYITGMRDYSLFVIKSYHLL